MKSSIRAIVKNGCCFKASTDQAKDYGLIKSVESKLKFNPKNGFIWTRTFTNNIDFPTAYTIKTSHPDLYMTPNTFILEPHTTCTVTITRMAQDQVLTAEEKIFIDAIRVPKGTFVEDITSIFRFKGKDYIVKEITGLSECLGNSHDLYSKKGKWISVAACVNEASS
ncbi:vesicle-associated protein 1-2 [Artemisia annua]|uniref:Vesicle-associated protein 1-2 n=1 Tax=Artemisia annua TaxID=35608 RepID=A0A2U1Q9A6_ARTAN|nr:vesicle-associated protein 1-2 [Artemisia annua]